MNKTQFLQLVKNLNERGCFYYQYTQGNDEYRSRSWQRRTSDYQLSLVNPTNGESFTVASGTTKKDATEHKESLIKRYGTWARSTL